MFGIGLWVSHRPETVLSIRYLERIKDIGFTTVAVMVDTMTPGWDPKWSDEQIIVLSNMCSRLGLELVITCWPDASIARIDAMVADLRRWIEMGAIVSAIEVDVEGLWYSLDSVTGKRYLHPGYTEISSHLCDQLLELAAEHDNDIRVELTTHTGHYELTADAKISVRVHRVCVQAYTLRYGNGRIYEWEDLSRGPGRGQKRAVQLFQRVVDADQDDPPKLTMGLAAWNQKFPGHTVADAMQAAWDAAVAAEPSEIRYWDSRNLFSERAEAAQIKKWMEEIFRKF